MPFTVMVTVKPLQGLVDGGVDGAEELIRIIGEHGAVVLWISG